MNSLSFVYKKVAGCSIGADVFWENPGDLAEQSPDQAEHPTLPVIAWIHGGALISGCRTDIKPDQKLLYVSAGFAVVSIDYRLAPETKLPQIIEDLQDAFRWIREELPAHVPIIDPQRIAVVGHSAGGYLALMSGFCIKPRPKAIVSFYGYGDITARWYSRPDPFYCTFPAVSKERAFEALGHVPLSCATGNTNRGEFYLYCRQHGTWPQEVAGFDPAIQDAAFTPYCPARNVTKDYPPTMLLHGDADTDVPMEQSRQMASLLKKARVPVNLIVVPNGAHGFDGRGIFFDPVVGDCLTKVIDFLLSHTA